uniref:Uncharacterized protein n=1 Tax=Phlebotomus papatasi TaxID=29031 RepID=A0A1B0DLJ8_PHLPP
MSFPRNQLSASTIPLILSLIVLSSTVQSVQGVWQENVRPKLYVELGSEEILRFQGNDTTIDNFKLMLRDGNSLLIGARNIVYNLSISDLGEQQRLIWYSPEDDVKMCVVKGKDEVRFSTYYKFPFSSRPYTSLTPFPKV